MDQYIDNIILGNCFEVSKLIPDESVQCIITSPPYYGLRDYGQNSSIEIGKETTPSLYVSNLVKLFNLLMNKLKSDGALWLNLGDTYINKELQGIPWKVAIALQNSGWILRNDVIWHKPNAMPSSVKDRLTVDHEYLFYFVKNRNYYFDPDSIREPHVTFSENSKMKGGRKHFIEGRTPEKGKNSGNPNLHSGDWTHAFNPLGRNKRTVWSIPLSKFRGAHFAVFPEKLIEPCLLSCTRKEDLVLDPFMGSGTTAIVALKNNRHYLGIELNPEYKKLADKRISDYIFERDSYLPLDIPE